MPSCAGLSVGAARLRPPWEVIHKLKVAADCATAMVRARRVMLVVRGRACTVGGEAEDHGAVGDGGDRLSGLVAGRRERSGYSYAHWELAGTQPGDFWGGWVKWVCRTELTAEAADVGHDPFGE